MRIILNNSSMVPIYEQVADQIKQQILEGELKENEALPSVRALSARLRISSLTVKKSYDRLEEEGFVATIHGKGSYVTGAANQLTAEARRKSAEEELAKAVRKAAASGFTADEIRQTLEILLESELE